MTSDSQVYIFGEVLLDVFPDGKRVLGGAPFNVAWHLQALGDTPKFISRVGDDASGRTILQAMRDWGMDIAAVQNDAEHPTGLVKIEFVEAEPHYSIVPDCAYDFIGADPLMKPGSGDLLYHGTLGLRNPVSRRTLCQLSQQPELAIFLDVNLRDPWWQIADVQRWLARARWVKLNQQELRLLGFAEKDLEAALASLQERFALEQVILTRGEAGALVRTAAGEIHRAVPEQTLPVVDAVGAGDAFSAVYLHGLRSGWSIPVILAAAQQFAGKVVGLRGATTSDPAFYQGFSATPN